MAIPAPLYREFAGAGGGDRPPVRDRLPRHRGRAAEGSSLVAKGRRQRAHVSGVLASLSSDEALPARCSSSDGGLCLRAGGPRRLDPASPDSDLLARSGARVRHSGPVSASRAGGGQLRRGARFLPRAQGHSLGISCSIAAAGCEQGSLSGSPLPPSGGKGAPGLRGKPGLPQYQSGTGRCSGGSAAVLLGYPHIRDARLAVVGGGTGGPGPVAPRALPSSRLPARGDDRGAGGGGSGLGARGGGDAGGDASPG